MMPIRLLSARRERPAPSRGQLRCHFRIPRLFSQNAVRILGIFDYRKFSFTILVTPSICKEESDAASTSIFGEYRLIGVWSARKSGRPHFDKNAERLSSLCPNHLRFSELSASAVKRFVNAAMEISLVTRHPSNMEDQLAYLIASVNRRLEEELQESLRPEGIPLEQFRILSALASSEGRSMRRSCWSMRRR
jgi:hypothetical protein